jgi:phage baseplate assembly protein W
MAYNPIQISPLDLNPDKAIGVNIPFQANDVFTSNFTTSKSLKNNITNFLLTNPGEIPLNPKFGGGIKNLIFTQISEDNLDYIERDIKQKLLNYFPNIDIVDFEVLSNPDYNSITIKFSYKIKSTNINDQIEINL